MSEHLTDEEQLARLKTWWDENGTSLVVGVLVVVAGVVGWRWYEGHQQERLATASDLYQQFEEAQGDARDALASRIVEEGGGTAYPAFVLLAQADAAVADGDAARAEDVLRRAVGAASGAELADLARLRLARVLFEEDKEDESLRVLEEIRGEGYLALAGELKGDIHLARDERRLAHEAYTQAASYLEAGEQRPVLEMKIADTADPSAS